MDYITFLNRLKKEGVSVFTLQDVEALFPQENRKTIKNNLTNWVKKEHITRLKKNVYECTQPGEKNTPEYYIANRLYQPSYISRESALSFYNILPEETAEVTSVTTKPTRKIKNKYGTFTYKTIKKKAYNGYKIMNIEGEKTLIADREKAFTDFIYYRLLDGQQDFKNERLDTSNISLKKAGEYAKQYNNKTVDALRKIL